MSWDTYRQVYWFKIKAFMHSLYIDCHIIVVGTLKKKSSSILIVSYQLCETKSIAISFGFYINLLYNIFFVVCGNGMYGEKCSMPCGKCEIGTFCNNVSGICPFGCQDKWQGSKCDSMYINIACHP